MKFPKNYSSFMYLLISVVALLIVFNLVDISSDSKKMLTTYAISNQENLSFDSYQSNPDSNDYETISLEGQAYSEKSYAFYYLFLMILATLISLITISVLMPFLKSYT